MEELIARLLRRREELAELLVYRRTLEPAVARLAAETRRKGDLEPLRRAIRRMAEPLADPEYMRFDTEFHLAVAQATQNRYLTREIEEIRMQLNDALSLLPKSETWHRRLSGEHEAIFDAIEAGNGEAAEAAAELHVANSEQSVRALLTAIRRRRA
jgi:GntR family transcriptional repressor for pyruvate dehydrogenase complex